MTIQRFKVGETYSSGKVVEILDDLYYIVECSCGNRRRVWHYNVLRGKGCRSCAQHKPSRPSATVDGKVRKEYLAYKNMIARCEQTMKSWFERYGQTPYHGMEIDEAWLGPDGFAAFYNDVGPAPSPDHMLDREDNNIGYLRGNVRWVTAQVSNVNKSNTRLLEAFGEVKSLQEWADDLGVSSAAIRQRLDILGWSVEDSVSKRPVGPRPSNDEYYMSIAGRVALRSTCVRRAVGCILVDKDNYVMSTGYNSVPAGFQHCTSSPCEGAEGSSGSSLDKCLSRHAEDVALMKCKDIMAIKTVYSTTAPCIFCTRRLLDTSADRIVFAEDYPHSSDSKKLWESYGREWVQMESPS